MKKEYEEKQKRKKEKQKEKEKKDKDDNQDKDEKNKKEKKNSENDDDVETEKNDKVSNSYNLQNSGIFGNRKSWREDQIKALRKAAEEKPAEDDTPRIFELHRYVFPSMYIEVSFHWIPATMQIFSTTGYFSSSWSRTQRNFYQMRINRLRERELAKRNAERLRDPALFPSVPKGDIWKSNEMILLNSDGIYGPVQWNENDLG